MPTEILEHLVALATELRAQRAKPTATPEEARAANAALRGAMRERGNYFPDIEAAAAAALERAGYVGGALSQGMLLSVVAHHGFSVRFVADLPRSVRSLTDLRTSRIYVKQEPVGDHSPRAVILQALGHFLLGHDTPRDFADFLRQRVEANYFAAAMLMPETAAVPFLRAAKDRRDLAVEDLIDVFSVSYEMAAHRVTNLITHHLGVACHFVKNDTTGVIYKAYQNDGVLFPADATGAIEGQRMCRQWSGRRVFAAADRYSPYYQYSDTPSGTYFCVAQVDPRAGEKGSRSASACRSALPLVPRPGVHDRDQVAVPGRRLLPARPGRAGRALGGHGLAVGPRAQPHPVGAPVRRLPRRRRRGHLRVPRPARRRVARHPPTSGSLAGHSAGHQHGDQDQHDHDHQGDQPEHDVRRLKMTPDGPASSGCVRRGPGRQACSGSGERVGRSAGSAAGTSSATGTSDRGISASISRRTARPVAKSIKREPPAVSPAHFPCSARQLTS